MTMSNNDDLVDGIDGEEDGTWIGIDLGTSNSACAIWDSNRGYPKWIRMGRLDLATTTKSNNKMGRTVPSMVMLVSPDSKNIEDDTDKNIIFQESELVGSDILDEYNIKNDNNSTHQDENDHQQQRDRNQVKVVVGNAALKFWDDSILHSTTAKNGTKISNSTNKSTGNTTANKKERKENTAKSSENQEGDDYNDHTKKISSAMITSIKRVIGYSKLQDIDEEFMKSLPFLLEEDSNTGDIIIPVQPIRSASGGFTAQEESNLALYLRPIQIIAIILRSIRLAAQQYLNKNMAKKRLNIPGFCHNGNRGVPIIRHCVVGVPVNYGTRQREIMKRACCMAGFDGHVSTIVESTAAAMAYGLFASAANLNNAALTASASSAQRQENNSSNHDRKIILVFDMGGGTTDVTIAEMMLQTEKSKESKGIDSANVNYVEQSKDNDKHNEHNKINNCTKENEDIAKSFRVIVTQGDGKLGGDDLDNALMKYVLEKYHNLKKNQIKTDEENFTMKTNSRKNPKTTREFRHALQHLSKNAKEQICSNYIQEKNIENKPTLLNSDSNTGDDKREPTNLEVNSVTINLPFQGEGEDSKITINQKEFDTITESIIERAETIVEMALEQYSEKRKEEATAKNIKLSSLDLNVDEIILIGGSSQNVPAIKTMLRKLLPFPTGPKELCTSVNGMSAVAHGAAIQAAVLSRTVPLHEVKSALMLDTNPHSIGIMIKSSEETAKGRQNRDELHGHYVEVLSKDTMLPAMGYKTCYLENIDQAGITIHAVEKVGTSENESSSNSKGEYQELGEFTFLLHRLSKNEKQQLIFDNNNDKHDENGATNSKEEDDVKEYENICRPIDVGMTLEADGKFIVSVFDKYDPEHVRKKEYFERMKREKKKTETSKKDKNKELVLADNEDYDMIKEIPSFRKEEITKEETLLILGIVLVFVLYIVVKLCLLPPPEEGSQIL